MSVERGKHDTRAMPLATSLRMFHAGAPTVPLGRLVRMRWARRVRILTRLTFALGRFDRVCVVPLVGCELSVGLFVLLDHDRDPNLLLPSNEPTGNRQG
jgi:hypothetical protein